MYSTSKPPVTTMILQLLFILTLPLLPPVFSSSIYSHIHKNHQYHINQLSTPTSTSSSSSTPLQLTLDVGGYINILYRDDTIPVASQLLLTSSTNSNKVKRLLVAFPDGNSGAMMYFVPTSSTTSPSPSLTFVNNSIHSITDTYDRKGIEGMITINGNMSAGVTLLGSIRTIRDYVEGNGVLHSIFNYTIAQYNTTYVRLYRQWINTTHTMDLIYQSLSPTSLTFDIIPPINTSTPTPPQRFNFILRSGVSTATMMFRVVYNETSVGTGYNPANLFLSSNTSGSTPTNNAQSLALNGITSNPLPTSEVSFLTYQSKFMAGGWRFLTYFGRDTMFALRLLMPIMQSLPIESALSSVIERLYVNTTNGGHDFPIQTGEVCHEETIGDYASYQNIQGGSPSLGSTPFYDYKMIDTSFLLLPTLAHYCLDLPQGKNRATSFLQKTSNSVFTQGQKYNDLLRYNVEYVMNVTAKFAGNPKDVKNLIALKQGQPVGNWRDSNQGLGYGRIPFDVNVALVPACLRAIQRLSDANIIDSKYRNTASQYASVWEQNVASYFLVELNTTVAESRLTNYTKYSNLSQSLSYGNGVFNGTSKVSDINMTSWLFQGNTSSMHRFYALSLFNNGTAVETLHSDLGIVLLYADNVGADIMSAVSDALLPYPRGLISGVGMVVANPALDSNTSNWVNFAKDQYHGTVVWGWQQGIMVAGLTRQLSFCNTTSSSSNSIPQVDTNPAPSTTPSWCSDTTLVANLRAGLYRLWHSIDNSGIYKYSEVWSYGYNTNSSQFSVVDLGTISPSGTESDAVQLWSYGFLALVNPLTS